MTAPALCARPCISMSPHAEKTWESFIPFCLPAFQKIPGSDDPGIFVRCPEGKDRGPHSGGPGTVYGKIPAAPNPSEYERGAGGGSGPPGMGSNSSGTLRRKASSERSEDLCAAVRPQSDGILEQRGEGTHRLMS